MRPAAVALAWVLLIAWQTAASAAGQTEDLTVVSGDSIELKTVTPMGELLKRDAATEANGLLLLSKPCSDIPQLTAQVRDTNGQAAVARVEKDETVADMARCQIRVMADVKTTAPASGWLTLAGAGIDPLTVSYTVLRSSETLSYWLIVLLGLVLAGLVLAATARRVARRNGAGSFDRMKERLNDRKNTWDFSKSWAANLAALGALTGTVLAASGVLKQFLPQYQTSGILTVNLFLGGLVVVAPIVYSAARHNRQATVQGFFLAAGVTLTAVLAQALLITFLLLHGGVFGLLVGVLMVAVVLWMLVRYVDGSLDDLTYPERDQAPGPEGLADRDTEFLRRFEAVLERDRASSQPAIL